MHGVQDRVHYTQHNSIGKRCTDMNKYHPITLDNKDIDWRWSKIYFTDERSSKDLVDELQAIDFGRLLGTSSGNTPFELQTKPV